MGIASTVFGMFKARKGEPVIEKFGPLQARLDGRIEIDTTQFIINDEYIAVENPGDNHQLTHVGQSVVAGTEITRYYLEGLSDKSESVLQVAGKNNPDECILFRKVDEFHPQDEETWCGVQATAGNDTFTFNDIVYENAWGNSVQHNETVEAAPSQDEKTYTYPCETALFMRSVSDDNSSELTEYAMVAIEDEERVVVYLGINILPAAIAVI